MSELEKLAAEILSCTPSQDGRKITAQIRLRFSFEEEGERVIGERMETVQFRRPENMTWRRTRLKAYSAAWAQLQDFLDGAPLANEPTNIFADLFKGDALAGGSDMQNDTLYPEKRQLAQSSLCVA